MQQDLNECMRRVLEAQDTCETQKIALDAKTEKIQQMSAKLQQQDALIEKYEDQISDLQAQIQRLKVDANRKQSENLRL